MLRLASKKSQRTQATLNNYIEIRPEAPGVRAKDLIPNFAIIENCTLHDTPVQGLLFCLRIIYNRPPSMPPPSRLLRHAGRAVSMIHGSNRYITISYVWSTQEYTKNFRHIEEPGVGNTFLRKNRNLLQ